MRRHRNPYPAVALGGPGDSPKRFRRVQVALIDTRQFIRDCIVAAFQEDDAEIDVIGYATLDEIDIHDPSLIVIWIESTGEDGVDELDRCLREIRRRFPETAIAAFVDDADRLVVKSAVACGICVIGAAKTNKDIAMAAIRLACAGGVFTLCDFRPPDGSQFASAFVDGFAETALRLRASLDTAEPAFSPALDPRCLASAADHACAMCSFTHREREVLDYLDRGLQNKNIAFALGISDSTVKVHLRNIMKKLKATNRTQVLFLMRQLPNVAQAQSA